MRLPAIMPSSAATASRPAAPLPDALGGNRPVAPFGVASQAAASTHGQAISAERPKIKLACALDQRKRDADLSRRAAQGACGDKAALLHAQPARHGKGGALNGPTEALDDQPGAEADGMAKRAQSQPNLDQTKQPRHAVAGGGPQQGGPVAVKAASARRAARRTRPPWPSPRRRSRAACRARSRLVHQCAIKSTFMPFCADGSCSESNIP